jgi:hypothetical protein
LSAEASTPGLGCKALSGPVWGHSVNAIILPALQMEEAGQADALMPDEGDDRPRAASVADLVHAFIVRTDAPAQGSFVMDSCHRPHKVVR